MLNLSVYVSIFFKILTRLIIKGRSKVKVISSDQFKIGSLFACKPVLTDHGKALFLCNKIYNLTKT